jgi:hypothetical protein
MMDFIKSDIAAKNASPRPIALTEWNMSATAEAHTSILNGIQAVILFSELIKNHYGMSARWLIANWEADGMFYKGSNSSIPLWNPRPAFFFIYYLQKFYGDYMISTASDDRNIVAYASTFSSGEVAVIIVNKGTSEQIVNIKPESFGSGENFYLYSLAGEIIGAEDDRFPQGVNVNGYGPDTGAGTWGPVDELEDIKAYAYNIGDEIKLTSPGHSVQFVLIDHGDTYLVIDEGKQDQQKARVPHQIKIYPSPASEYFKIDLQQGRYNRIDIVDLLGRVVYSRNIDPSEAILSVKPDLPSGLYFVRMLDGKQVAVAKLLIDR